MNGPLMRTRSPFRCVGLMGRLAGHKFMWTTVTSDTIYVKDHCQRCGMPLGGWPL